MKHVPLRTFAALVLSLLAMPSLARASHIFGADLFYKVVNDTSYAVTLVLYGDCSGQSFPSLPGSTPRLVIYNGAVAYDTIYMPNVGALQPGGDFQFGEEVSQVCADQAGSTTCSNPGNPLPGVKRFFYSSVVTLPGASANWRFLFTGHMASTSNQLAGRSNSIGNLQGIGGSIIALEATLNNLPSVGVNSSPTFTTIPTPFYCVNIPQAYNQGAVDNEGDSLTYALVPAMQGGETISTANYQAGYSATQPVASEIGSFSFNNLTGQLGFTPSSGQQSVVVNRVYEYRDGVLIGTSMREMTFTVLTNCLNSAPSSDLNYVSNLSGGIIDENAGTINVCSETAELNFDLSSTDINGDQINVTYSGLPGTSEITIDNNGSGAPMVHFHWPVQGVPEGSYTFYITFKDDGCPLSSQQTKAFTIRVIPPPTVGVAVVSPTDCSHQAAVEYTFQGTPPYAISISQGGQIIREFTAYSNILLDSLPAGISAITVALGEGGCDTVITATVNDGGIYPFGPEIADSVFYCTGDVPTQLAATPTDPNGTVTWYSPTGQPLAMPPTPATNAAGAQQFVLSQTYGACTSVKDTVTAVVSDKPVALLAVSDNNVCSKDGLVATASTVDHVPATYQWNWNGGDAMPLSDSTWAVSYDTGGVFTITLLAVNAGCASAPATTTINVRQSPSPYYEVGTACEGRPVTLIYTGNPLPGQTFAWDFGNTATANTAGPFVLTYANAGQYTIALETSANGCSLTSNTALTVHANPGLPAAFAGDGVACLGDEIQLPAAQDATYRWEPANQILQNLDGSQFVRIMEPVTISVTATNVYGCSVAGSFAIHTVEPCCTFSYPTAFSPNGDGRNDFFRPILYGNAQYYDLQIFNRWGQQVFRSTDQNTGWNGMSNGQASATDVYFYRLHAKCLTGRLEDTKGEVTLVR